MRVMLVLHSHKEVRAQLRGIARSVWQLQGWRRARAAALTANQLERGRINR